MRALTLFAGLLAVLGCRAVEVKRPRGVSLSHRGFYDEMQPFTCLDGSKKIPYDRVNDDYCDCADGSDEPGTSACANGRFHCTNAGYRPLYIPSSRVNDGICDCCDATDEYNSGALCQNTCREMGRKEREELEKKAEMAREGVLLKQKYIEEAQKGREEKQAQLKDLLERRQSAEKEADSLRATKEEVEKPEKEAKDAHKKEWEERREAEKAALENKKSLEAFIELDQNSDGTLSVQELLTHSELDSDGDGSLSDQEAQDLLAGSQSVDVTSFHDSIWPQIKEKYKSKSEAPSLPAVDEGTESHPEITHEEEGDDDGEEGGDDDDEEDDEDDLDEEDYHKAPPNKSQGEESEMPPYDDSTQQLIDAAEKARNEYEEASKALREIEDTIRNLEKEISLDFGSQGEFSYLYGQCYELSTSEYIYRLCPFNRVTQKPKVGGSETNLGVWGNWAGPENDKFSAMKYEQGTGCWQGPNRSTMVKLLCGKETVVTSTSEPSRCEYLMEFYTPAICQQPAEIPHSEDHDEL